jgi:hypothetical protein
MPNNNDTWLIPNFDVIDINENNNQINIEVIQNEELDHQNDDDYDIQWEEEEAAEGTENVVVLDIRREIPYPEANYEGAANTYTEEPNVVLNETLPNNVEIKDVTYDDIESIISEDLKTYGKANSNHFKLIKPVMSKSQLRNIRDKQIAVSSSYSFKANRSMFIDTFMDNNNKKQSIVASTVNKTNLLQELNNYAANRFKISKIFIK